MSYELLVFDPGNAPRQRAAFLDWLEAQPALEDGAADCSAMCDGLRGWYRAMIVAWPDLRDCVPDASAVGGVQYVDERATEYAIDDHTIYAQFTSSLAKEAYADVCRLADEHEVGFYDVGGDEGQEELYFPGDVLATGHSGVLADTAEGFRTIESKSATLKASWLHIFRRTQ